MVKQLFCLKEIPETDAADAIAVAVCHATNQAFKKLMSGVEKKKMIGRLNGKLVEKQPPNIVIECFGVGYEVEAPMSTICDLPELGSVVTLLTHHHIRDDANLLFGFLTTTERELFRILIKVNGVGNRMALTILSGVSVGEFVRVVKNDQWQQLTSLPGVGRKQPNEF